MRRDALARRQTAQKGACILPTQAQPIHESVEFGRKVGFQMHEAWVLSWRSAVHMNEIEPVQYGQDRPDLYWFYAPAYFVAGQHLQINVRCRQQEAGQSVG